MPEELVSTSAPVEAGAPAEDSVEVPDGGADGTEGGEESGEGGEPAEPASSARPVIDGKLSPAFRTLLDKIKTENPQYAKAIQRALFAEDRLRRDLPGGFKEIQEIRERLDGYGGPEAIEDMRHELNGWAEFDAKYSTGDPKVLEFLTADPESSEAFLRIAPAAFDKYRELDQEAYSGYISQVFLSDMQQQQIPFLLYALGRIDNAEVKEIAQKLGAYMERLNGLAQYRPKVSARAAGSRRDEDLNRREQDLTRKEWGTQTSSLHNKMYQSEWARILGDRKLNETQRVTIQELYGLALQKLLPGDFTKKLEQYFSSGQKDGFLRYFESIYRSAVPRALRSAVGRANLPKPAAKSPGNGNNGVPAKAEAGFTMLPKKPEFSQVDNKRTTPAMWSQRKAIMRDGKQVQWPKPA